MTIIDSFNVKTSKTKQLENILGRFLVFKIKHISPPFYAYFPVGKFDEAWLVCARVTRDTSEISRKCFTYIIPRVEDSSGPATLAIVVPNR